MEEQMNFLKLVSILGAADTDIGKAIVFSEGGGEPVAIRMEKDALWYEALGLLFHQAHHETDQQIDTQSFVHQAEAQIEGQKIVVDLSNQNKNHHVVMTPRAAQRLRNQLTGLLHELQQSKLN